MSALSEHARGRRPACLSGPAVLACQPHGPASRDDRHPCDLGCFKDEGPEQTGSTSSLHGLGVRVAVDSVGSAGLVNRSDAAWTEGCGEVACTLALRLYCVEQQP